MKRADIYRLINSRGSTFKPQWSEDLEHYFGELLLNKAAEIKVSISNYEGEWEARRQLVELAAFIVDWLEIQECSDYGFNEREEDETADDFYERIALVFDDISLFAYGNEIKALSEIAEVPYTTAVHWVRESRDRGFLPLSQRQSTLRSAP